MKWRILFLACLVLSVTFTGAGCTQLRVSSAANSSSSGTGAKIIDPQQVQRTTMNFAVRYMTAIADVYDQVQSRSTTLEVRALAQQSKLNSSLGAMGNAVDPNPVLGLMDMTLMVALTKEIMEEPWAQERFGTENAAKILVVLTTYDAIIWDIAASYLTVDQIAQLRGLVKQWHEQHPGQHLVGGARLADFPEAKQTQIAGAHLANSVFGLVRLDPFTGLDPAVRQVEESRILAERMFFYLQYMPTLISWQTDILYDNMLAETLAEPQVKKLLEDTSTISGSTTRFTDSTARFTDATASFSDYCGQFARTVEKFRADIPEQLAALVKQLDEVVATQREAALKQATTELDQVVATQRDAALNQANEQLAAQRDAAIKQLNAAVQTQQELIAKNLQDVLNTSIDRLYQRTYSVVLIFAGSLLAVLVIYRLIATRLAAKQPRP